MLYCVIKKRETTPNGGHDQHTNSSEPTSLRPTLEAPLWRFLLPRCGSRPRIVVRHILRWVFQCVSIFVDQVFTSLLPGHLYHPPKKKTSTFFPCPDTRGVDAVLVGDDLPELGADLVSALASPRTRRTDVARGGPREDHDEENSLTDKTIFHGLSLTWGVSLINSFVVTRDFPRSWPPWTCTSSRMAEKERRGNSKGLMRQFEG